jgi:hypothetical protein
VLAQAIAELQGLEQSVARKTLSNLQVRLALRSCLKELRTLAITHPVATTNDTNGDRFDVPPPRQTTGAAAPMAAVLLDDSAS